ncbi:hypothetical protein HELRODRAFT_166150 [Helobdella robusta]|uniref:SEC7 domain-containing protein n=1 Tax=Helobdella robusta TaxID=6412 RepID=T1EXU4_HELRO|nr:hypothetical protein HELRODRAFT_166150 [Helobdella robusta]ESN90479.1 hypothetical protein HELRODRAFT_166150 [Helobdella robusta]
MAAKYNLSSFFVDHWIKMLENEYGGRNKSQNAAKIIQSTFRKYMLQKKFVKLCEMIKKEPHFSFLPGKNIVFSEQSEDEEFSKFDLFNNDLILHSLVQDYLVNEKIKLDQINSREINNLPENFYDVIMSYKNIERKPNSESSVSHETLQNDESQIVEDVIKPEYVDSLQKTSSTSPLFFYNSLIEDSFVNSRKMLYKVGLNLFNKNPEKGIKFLIENGFIAQKPSAIAKFFQTRSGISKQMIGEYLGDINKSFNNQDKKNLKHFVEGEAQKIEKLVEVFSFHYCKSNVCLVSQFKSADTVFLLAFAIIMLNTDLHNPNIKPKKKMKMEEFVKNLEGVDGGNNIDRNFLTHLYENILNEQLIPAADHTSLVLKIEKLIVDKKPVDYKYGVMLKPRICDYPNISFNARNNSDQMNLIEDLREVIGESNKMESIRIDEELEKQRLRRMNKEFVCEEDLLNTVKCENTKNLGSFRLSDIENFKIRKHVSHSLADIYNKPKEPFE